MEQPALTGRGGRKRGTGTPVEERWADDFACALLMPEREFREAWKRDQSRAVLVYRFKVPMEAVQRRLRMLDLVP